MNDIMNYKFSKEESTDKNVFNDDNYSEENKNENNLDIFNTIDYPDIDINRVLL